jgi:SNF family Na+-dependent transporter
MAATVTVCNCMTSIFAGFVIFGSLGYVAQASGQRVEDVAGSGMSLTFVTLATTLSLFPAAPIWAIMFFVMLVTVGLGTQMADMETQITALLDQFVHLRNHKTLVTLAVCVTGFVGAISMTFQVRFFFDDLDQLPRGHVVRVSSKWLWFFLAAYPAQIKYY